MAEAKKATKKAKKAEETNAPQFAGTFQSESDILHRKPFSVKVGDKTYTYNGLPLVFLDEVLYAFMTEQASLNMHLIEECRRLMAEGKLPKDFALHPDAAQTLIDMKVPDKVGMKMVIQIMTRTIRNLVAMEIQEPVEYVEKYLKLPDYAALLAIVKNDPDVLEAANIVLKNVVTPAALQGMS